MALGIRLLLLVLIAAVPVLGLEVYDQLAERAQRRAAVSADALNTASLLAERLNQFVETARSLAIATAQLPEVRRRDAAGCRARARALKAQFPVVLGIGAVDPDGIAFCRSSGDERINIADRPYFQQALREKRFVASGYVLSRAVNRPAMTFAIPALDDAGAVQAVVVIGIDLETLSEALARTPLPAGGTASVVDATGTVLARVPLAMEHIGQRLPDRRLVEGLRSQHRGTAVAAGLDGTERIYGFAPLVAPAEFHVIVGVPMGLAFAEIDARFTRNLSVLGGIFLFAAVAALLGGEWMVRRPLVALQGLAKRLAKGDLSARADLDRRAIGEVGALAASLHAMADALEKQQAAVRESERRVQDVAANLPGIIYRRALRPDGRLIYRYVAGDVQRLFGVPVSDFLSVLTLEQHVQRLAPEDRQGWLDAVRASAASLAPFDHESRTTGADGRVRWVRSMARPYREPDGTIVWDGLSLDITAQMQAREALEESEERLRAAVEGAELGTWEIDVATGHSRWSERTAAMLGLPATRTEAGRRARLELIHPEDRARIVAAFDHVARGAPYQVEFRVLRPDGEVRWLASYGKTLPGPSGRAERVVGIVQDITERKRAEERQALLMAELDHRVKNTLAVVQSIANHTLSADQPARTFTGRLAALAQTHGLLAASHWEGADLRAIVEQELAPYRSGPNERITISGEELLLPPRTAQTLAMAVHELTTNAAKYGALSVPEGRVEIGWEVQDRPPERRLLLEWRERGGPPAEPPSRRGFGSRMIEWSVKYELDGAARLAFHPDGVHCSMDIPLPKGTTRTGAPEERVSA